MCYSEPLINQIYRFFLGVGFGAILAVVYELFAVVRSVMGQGKVIVIILDIVFSVIFTVLSFFFMLIYNGGEMRFNIVLAILLGLYAFHVTVGKNIVEPLVKLNEKIWHFFRKRRFKKNKN